MDVGIAGLREKLLPVHVGKLLGVVSMFFVMSVQLMLGQANIIGDSAKAMAVAAQPSDVVVSGRKVATYYSTLLGLPPAQRAGATKQRIDDALSQLSNGKLQVTRSEAGFAIMLDGMPTVFFSELDHDPLTNETIEQVVQRSLKSMEIVVQEYREAHSIPDMLRGIAFAILATALFYLVVRLSLWGKKKLLALAVRFFEKRITHTHVKEIINGTQILSAVLTRLITLLSILVIIVSGYLWLAFVFEQFPATRSFGDQMASVVTTGIKTIVESVVHSLPDLLMVLLIFVAARFLLKALDQILSRIERRQIRLAFIDSEALLPTRKLVGIVVWIFAFAMAYPYIPGSSTDAFKGVSVVVGLMLSLGASSAIGQAASGLILMYARTIRVGDWVTVGGVTGRVSRIGFFQTRLTTPYTEEAVFPNSSLVGNMIVNHSKLASIGVANTITVTIGYDAPWRLVHKMLLAAANKTTGVAIEPAPFITQSGLSDFYVEYRLTCQITDPARRRATIDALNAAVQDQFNENNVQIMSPHYFADPTHPKVVDRKNWDPPLGGNSARQSGFL